MTKQVLIIAALAIFAPFANAQATVYFYCDTVLTLGGTCDIYVDALPKVTNSTVVIGGAQKCRYDVTALAVGTHTLNCAVTSVAAEPLYGAQTSAKAPAALSYTVVGQLPPPTNLRTGP